MDNELERIKNVMQITDDAISPTFCMAKWHHTTLYLQTGETHSCYHPPPHKIPLREIEVNPSALHNTNQKKQERKAMLMGQKPSGCNYCWKIEAMGEEYISDRKIKTASIYNPTRLKEIETEPADFDINPEYIEISFSNECNFKCGYCHPKASSRFWNEIDKFGPYAMATEHRCDIDWFKVYAKEEENPYVDAWRKWWPEVSKTLNILRITGGEPLMHKSTWELFESLDKDPKPYLQIELNSNLGVKNSLVQKLADTVKRLKDENKIKNFKLYSSIDTWTKRAEYTRTGLDIELWEKNLDCYLSTTNMPITFMITFNLFSVTSFQTLLEKILEWREKYNTDYNVGQWQRVRFDTPHLKEPLHFDMNILPKEEFMPMMESHLKFIEDNLDSSDRTKFSQIEYEKFKRVVDYMGSVKYDSDKLLEARKNFYLWFTEYDRRRNVKMEEYFPELVSFKEMCRGLVEANLYE